MENPLKMYDLGVPLFLETSNWGYPTDVPRCASKIRNWQSSYPFHAVPQTWCAAWCLVNRPGDLVIFDGHVFEWRYLQPIKRKILALLSKISFQEIGKVNTNYIPPLTFYSEDILFFCLFLLRFFFCPVKSIPGGFLKKGKETSFSCNQGNEGKDNQQALYQCFDLGSSHQAVPSINSIHLEETLSERHPKYISTSFLVFYGVFFLVGIYLWESKYWTSGVLMDV